MQMTMQQGRASRLDIKHLLCPALHASVQSTGLHKRMNSSFAPLTIRVLTAGASPIASQHIACEQSVRRSWMLFSARYDTHDITEPAAQAALQACSYH